MKTTARYEVVSGTRINVGVVLATFPESATYKCGGAATACLRWFAKNVDKTGAAPMFFRRVAA